MSGGILREAIQGVFCPCEHFIYSFHILFAGKTWMSPSLKAKSTSCKTVSRRSTKKFTWVCRSWKRSFGRFYISFKASSSKKWNCTTSFQEKMDKIEEGTKEMIGGLYFETFPSYLHLNFQETSCICLASIAPSRRFGILAGRSQYCRKFKLSLNRSMCSTFWLKMFYFRKRLARAISPSPSRYDNCFNPSGYYPVLWQI